MSKYVDGQIVNMSGLRHDLQTLVVPLETAIELSRSTAGDPNAALLQNEILKSLKGIVGELKLLPEKLEIKG